MKLRLLVVTGALAAVTACGGSSPTSSGSPPTAAPSPTAQTLTITETEFSLSPATLTLKPGSYSIHAENTGKFPHDLHIVDSGNTQVGATSAVLSPGGSSDFTVTLKSGTYTMYCAVDSHRERGMQGTITVS